MVPFSFNPDLAIFEILLLPDGDQSLQAVDPFKRRLERGPPVRRRHDHGTLASPISMVPSRCTMAMRLIANLPAISRPISAILRIAIGFVAFVFEPKFARPWYCSDHALEIYHSRRHSLQKRVRALAGIDRLAREREEMPFGLRDLIQRASEPPLTGGSNATSSASASGWVERGKLLIARKHDAGSHPARRGNNTGIMIENRTQAGTGRQFETLLRAPANILQQPEK